MTSAYPDWAAAGDPGLDPLPPRPSAQARPGERRRNVWSPDAGHADARYDEQSRHHPQGYDQQRSGDSSGDWERMRSGTAGYGGGTAEYGSDLGEPWLDPEPEHEGDSW